MIIRAREEKKMRRRRRRVKIHTSQGETHRVKRKEGDKLVNHKGKYVGAYNSLLC